MGIDDELLLKYLKCPVGHVKCSWSATKSEGFCRDLLHSYAFLFSYSVLNILKHLG